MKPYLWLTVLCLLACSQELRAAAPDLIPELRIETMAAGNTDTAEVGEEIFFDASGSTVAADFVPSTWATMTRGEYVWNFGDGSVMGPTPDAWGGWAHYDTGPCFVHFYMKPGTYTVTMQAVNPDGNSASSSADIHIYGEEIISGFELQHAPYFGRVAQYIYALIPATVRQIAGNQLRLRLTSDMGYSEQLLLKSGLSAKESLLLHNGDLPAGNYILTVELLDAGNNRLAGGLLRERFPKPYAGNPEFGINENNAYCKNGTPFFMITPWMLNLPDISYWANRFVNSFEAQGWVSNDNNYSIPSWNAYLNEATKFSTFAIGPAAWPAGAPQNHGRLCDINIMRNYLNQCKTTPGLGMWLWYDEPNLGGQTQGVPVQVVSAWSYLSHKADPQRPVLTNYAGMTYYPMYTPLTGNWASGFNYLLNEDKFGGKKHFPADAMSIDAYPLEFRMYPDPNHGIFDLWVETLENFQKTQGNLLPFNNCIETQDVADPNAHTTTPGPTPAQVRMESWLSIVHHFQALSWFQYFAPTPPENFGIMQETLEATARLGAVILGPEPSCTVTDTANSAGKRVDTLIRETTTDIWIFAQRLTEPDFEWGKVYEPETINVDFSVTSLPNASTVAIEDSCQWQRVWEPHGALISQTTFTFNTNQAPIKPGTIILGGNYGGPYHPWYYLADNGNSTLATAVSNPGVTNQGTVNYTTGQITLTFADPILAGADNLRISYAPVRGYSALPINSTSQFSDTFGREELKVYKISKAAPTVPVLSIVPSAIDFGAVALKQSKEINLQITNIGIGTAAGTASLSPKTPYCLSGDINYSLANGQTATITVHFSPQTVGPAQTMLQFSGAQEPQLLLSGQGSLLGANLQAVLQAYPNPWKPGSSDTRHNRASGIVFEPMPAKAKIRFFDLSGELVYSHDKDDSSSSFEWNGTNRAGKVITSGVYLYTITNSEDASQKAKGKIVVIR